MFVRKPSIVFVLFLALAAAAACQKAAEPLSSGIDLAQMDKAVRPQDDLFRYVNGTWLANTPFPPEYPYAGASVDLYEKAQSDLRAILVDAASAVAAGKATPEMQRIGDMYTSFMDEKTVEARGATPLEPLFDEIAAIDGPAALARFFGAAPSRGISVPFGVYVYPDDRRSSHNIAYLDQDGLGMPNREYYLRTEETYAGFRRKWIGSPWCCREASLTTASVSIPACCRVA